MTYHLADFGEVRVFVLFVNNDVAMTSQVRFLKKRSAEPLNGKKSGLKSKVSATYI